MLGHWTQDSRQREPAWAAGLKNPDAAAEPQQMVWTRYIESRLRHFERTANPRNDPVPVMLAGSRND